MLSWAWRVPFLMAGPLGIVALFIRLKLEDTPEFRRMSELGEVSTAPLRELRSFRKNLVVAAGIATLYGVSFYMVFTYLITFLRAEVGLSAGYALLSVSCGGLVALVLLPLSGALSDKVGRRPVLLVSGLGFLVLSYPLFLLAGGGSLGGAIAGAVCLSALQATFLTTAFATLSELFPARVRTTGVSVSANFAVALFGGMAPFFATLLISKTGNPASPALYLAGAAAVGCIALMFMNKDLLVGGTTDLADEKQLLRSDP
jgi:MHS family proline/betaine transporter-like MFS transporter